MLARQPSDVLSVLKVDQTDWAHVLVVSAVIVPHHLLLLLYTAAGSQWLVVLCDLELL